MFTNFRYKYTVDSFTTPVKSKKQEKLNEFQSPYDVAHDFLSKTDSIPAEIASVISLYGIFFFVMSMVLVSVGKFNEHLSKKSEKYTELFKKVKITHQEFEVFIFESIHASAFVFPFTGSKVFVSSGMTKLLTDGEITAILCNEYNHYKNKDELKKVFSKTFIIEIIFLTLSYYPQSIIIRMILFSVSEYILQIPFNLLHGNPSEFESDQFAIKHGYKKELISALKKIEKDFDEKFDKGNILYKILMKFNSLFDNNPSYKDRIRKIMEEDRVKKDTKVLLASPDPMKVLYSFKDKYGFNLQSVMSLIK